MITWQIGPWEGIKAAGELCHVAWKSSSSLIGSALYVSDLWDHQSHIWKNHELN
jgi:hypothetical protein